MILAATGLKGSRYKMASIKRIEHSGQVPWDSGMCGIIYVDKEQAKAEYGKEYSEEKVREWRN